MAKPDFLSLLRKKPMAKNASDNSADMLGAAPLGGTREQAMQRLQIGLSGLGVMVLVIGLATVFTQRAQGVEDVTVPNAAATTEPIEEVPQEDPLADAGVVPDIPVEAEENEQTPAPAPEVGDVAEEAEVEDTEAQ